MDRSANDSPPPPGTRSPPQWKRLRDPASHLEVRFYTQSSAHNYPLDHTRRSISADERFLIFHSERSGWVQLHRLDLESGESLQLTDATMRRSGWALWCERELRGVHNHLSVLNVPRDEVCYFDDQRLEAVNIHDLTRRTLVELPGRTPVAPADVSPDGSSLVFLHADREAYERAVDDKIALRQMRQTDRLPYEQWRRRVPVTLSSLDVKTGRLHTVRDFDHHRHAVAFVNHDTLLIAPTLERPGFGVIGLDGQNLRDVRRADGRHGSPAHPVSTRTGVFYDVWRKHGRRRRNRFGRYDFAVDRYDEVDLHLPGRVHPARDPDGRFYAFEHQWRRRELVQLTFPKDPKRRSTRRLRKLAPVSLEAGRRFRAQPFLSPNRAWLFFTDILDNYLQLCAINVESLVDQKDSWWNY